MTLNKFLLLNPVSYHLKFQANEDPKKASESKNKTGFIAQEVEMIFLELAQTSPDRDMKTLSYKGLIPTMVKGIHELTEENRAMNQRIDVLEEQFQSLNKELEHQKSKFKNNPTF